MITLKFTINKYYLAFLLVNQLEGMKKRMDRKDYKELYTLINSYKNTPHFYLINLKKLEAIEWGLTNIYVNNSLKDVGRETNSIFEKIFRMAGFQKILKETKNYLKTVQKQWKQNEKQINQYLENILKIDLPALSITVIIVHPIFKKGRSFSNNLIIYGHKEEWKNYNIVYLTHEALHIIFSRLGIKHDDVSHTLIELITDNSLKRIFNNKKSTIGRNSINIGHPKLLKIKKEILPYWLKYIKSKDKNIVSFYQELIAKVY